MVVPVTVGVRNNDDVQIKMMMMIVVLNIATQMMNLTDDNCKQS